MATASSLLTAEEYIALPDPFEGPTELVKGVLVQTPPTRPRHGEICLQIGYLLRLYLDKRPTGRALSNDAGFKTERDRDTVRGADIAYYSFERVPKGPLPAGLLDASPDLVFEVLLPSDRWSEVQIKVAEYLDAGVTAVCVVDDDTRSVHVFRLDQPMRIFKSGDEFTVPDILSDFRVTVARFFE
ncbi:MAG: Uma2 family endonuclease [Pirellulales bacterium]